MLKFAKQFMLPILLLPGFLVIVTGAYTSGVQPVTDPLPSWKDGPTKKAILAYVKAVTTKDGPDYVPAEDRIATFDNDGTL